MTLLDGRVVRRHVDALRNREVLYPIPKPPQAPESDDSEDLFLPDISATTPTCAVPSAAPVQSAPVRRSNHCRPPPDRLGW